MVELSIINKIRMAFAFLLQGSTKMDVYCARGEFSLHYGMHFS